ncbi:hypothetical protein BTO30_16125 [Domibacillus antri]|uniref:Uncharacterized protein n=1 Tax=Domibacillus antri TaxID=1714264 RepID=A0A1Q8Q1I6_9BACI|nr:hypothetical protein [Domibacillus antri]OLN21206.1 hypothetical protein BTO30_16125 [Domibacillus antri]
MFKRIIKPKTDESLWEWSGTQIIHFACHKDAIDDFIRSNTDMYAQQGYEVIDTYITESSMNYTVKLLLKPIQKDSLTIKEDAQPITYKKVQEYDLPEKIEIFSARLHGAEQMLMLILHGLGFRKFLELLSPEEKALLKKMLEEGE